MSIAGHKQSRAKVRVGLAALASAALLALPAAQSISSARAQASNPCAPRAANPCGPASNPCGAADDPCAAEEVFTLTDQQAAEAYKKLMAELESAYAKSGMAIARQYQKWTKTNTVPYQSGTHGERYVNNYSNATAKDYERFEPDRVLPVGSILVKDSIVPQADATAQPGPLFVMEKMPAGFSKESADWKYTLVMPDGAIIGQTNGQGGDNVVFCAECHQAAGKGQAFFLPEQYRVRR